MADTFTAHPRFVAKQLLALLERARIGLSTEAQAQSDIERMLTAQGYAFERETVLSEKDRIDFLVGSVGIEVKTSGRHTRRAILKQLSRYAASERVEVLILVTATAWPSQSGEIHGKPVLVASLTKGWIG